MKKSTALLWAMIGGFIVAFFSPLIGVAVQTYVLPDGATTTQRAEMLTNAPNRDEAMRSSFSGTSAPSSPTPVAGQLWFDTANDRLLLRNAASSAWNRVFLGAASTVTCAAGYTEVRGWCIDTDGNFTLIRSTTNGGETSYTTSVVHADAKIAMIRVRAFIQKNVLDDSTVSSVAACAIPGDSSMTAVQCSTTHSAQAAVSALAQKEANGDTGTAMVRTDSSGQIKTICNGGGAANFDYICSFSLISYMP